MMRPYRARVTRTKLWPKLWGLFAFGLCSSACALTLTGLTPQGEVAQVRQVVARFDQSAIHFGDPKAPAPLTLACRNDNSAPLTQTSATGRWLNDKQWVFDFADDLPAGVRCTVTPVRGFKSPAGAVLKAQPRYAFNTGGPAVSNIFPPEYDADAIDEQQLFLLQLSGPAAAASLSAHVWCSVEGIGERVPVQVIEGAQRDALLKASDWAKDAKKEPLRYPVLQCKRTLPPDAKVQLVYGKGVATPSGVANSVEKRYDFKVRKPFAVSFSCERQNAQAGCLPVRPMRLLFSAPVTRALAARITLTGGGKTLAPTFDTDAGSGPDAQLDGIAFAPPPFNEQTDYTIALPKDFKDVSGRTLASPESFPVHARTDAMPPLAKFAAAPFGVIERLADPDGVATLPVTVRRVEPALAAQSYTPGRVGDLSARSDAEIIRWMHKLRVYDETKVSREQAARDVNGPLPPALHGENRDPSVVESRTVSLLAGQSDVRTLALPRQQGNDPRPFEVVGIPLAPGYHVVEIASGQLGQALLNPGYGAARTMFVRTGVLVTNLAVHFKLGRENALAWVTTLDKGQPVPGARVQVSDCNGKVLTSGVTDASGIARFEGLSPSAPECQRGGDGGYWYSGDTGYFVSARAAGAKGVEDLAFVWSDWQRGIEPWRFNLPTSDQKEPDRAVHTLFDRTLFRAGETVSMKHLFRIKTGAGNGFAQPPAADWFTELVITHLGSGQQYKQPLTWRKTATGGLSAESTFAIPAAAKLGMYEVSLRKGTDQYEQSVSSGSFRV
ncbi:MAG: alpha-2-macroglobulin, partial [Burkholderiaceae bacterium]|nr:alpha-2-macroglobulin [Burkholderiaceae bacterium]